LRQVLEGQDSIRIEGDRFIFASEVLFEPNSATLAPAGEAEIANIADILRGIADDIPAGIDWVIRVDGHTDNIPITGGRFADNWELSQARALSVVRFMSEDLDIDPRRLAANGFGEFQPINPLDTPEARAQNRRIELKLTEK
jgi:chemotaxis protein MotB